MVCLPIVVFGYICFRSARQKNSFRLCVNRKVYDCFDRWREQRTEMHDVRPPHGRPAIAAGVSCVLSVGCSWPAINLGQSVVKEQILNMKSISEQFGWLILIQLPPFSREVKFKRKATVLVTFDSTARGLQDKASKVRRAFKRNSL